MTAQLSIFASQEDQQRSLPVPRPVQEECLEDIQRALAEGVNRMVVSMATGGGKTIIMGFAIDDISPIEPQRDQVFVLAHRKELVEQNADKIRWINPNLTVDIEMANLHADPNADVISVSVQTLGREGSDRIKKFDPNRAKVIIVDEVHHCSEDNDSYMSILRYFGADQPDSKVILMGFSATVQRADKKGLDHVFDEIVFHAGIEDGIRDKWLSPIRAMRVDTEVDISQVATRAGDFAIGELEDAINTDARNELIYSSWLNHVHKAGRKSTLIFCADVAHIQSVTRMFRENGVDARGVSGGTPKEMRTQINAAFHQGDFPVLVNHGVYTEGSDFPCIDAIIMARPTKSPVLFIQCIGRGLRLFDGKEDCLVLDIVDACAKNSLITTPVLFDLSEDFDAEGEDIFFASKKIKQMAIENPSAIMATSIKDARDIIAGEVDLLSMREPDQRIQDMTTLRWRQIGNKEVFRADIPRNGEHGDRYENGFVRIDQDSIGHWAVTHCQGDGNEREVKKRNAMALAFQSADAWLENSFPNQMALMKKGQDWHGQRASEAQMKFLKKLGVRYQGNPTKLEASDMIDKALMARKVKRKQNINSPAIPKVKVGKIGASA